MGAELRHLPGVPRRPGQNGHQLFPQGVGEFRVMIPELRPLGQVLGSSTRAIPGALVESSTTPSSGRQERSVGG